MRITQEADNAFRVILYLAGLPEGERSTARTISEAMMISVQFTLKTLNKLTKNGLTCAYRGVNGGYALNKPAKEITLKEIIEVVDGPIAINRCLLDKSYCNRNFADHCPVHDALAGVQKTLVSALDAIRIDQLMDKDS
jgi:Rrf2 family iron-sulfur cluster assembly transcriptional regulator